MLFSMIKGFSNYERKNERSFSRVKKLSNSKQLYNCESWQQAAHAEVEIFRIRDSSESVTA
jgi:hypothetical protein